MISRFRVTLSATFLFLCSVSVQAAQIEYELVQASLNGTPVTGSFVIDDVTEQVVAWNIITELGMDDVEEFEFDGQVHSIETGELVAGAGIILRELQASPQALQIGRPLDLRIAETPQTILGYGANGGPVTLTQCFDCTPVRTGSGAVVPRDFPVSPLDAGSDLTFTASPGETLTQQISVSGGVYPVAAFAEIGDLSPQTLTGPGVVTYTLTVPLDVLPGDVFQDFLFFSDSSEDGIEILVTVNVVEAEPPPPDLIGTLEISGAPAGTVSAEFAVEGAFPIELAAELGSVEPAILTEAGNATYSLTIAADVEPGQFVEDTISLIDAAGVTRIIGVTVEIVAAQRDLALLALLSPNERELAEWFDDVCPRIDDSEAGLEDLRSICARLRDPDTTDEQVAAALRAINPEELLAATTSALRLTRVQHGNLSQRINAVRSGALGRGPNTRGAGIDVSGLNLQIGGQVIPGAVVAAALDGLLGGGASADDSIGGSDFGRWGLFVNGSVAFGDQTRSANEAGFDFNTQGITAGIDYRLRDNAFFGAAVGFAAVDVDFDDRGGKMDIDAWNLSLFGTYFHEDKYYLDALANFGRTKYDSRRNIRFTDAQGSVDRTARGSTNGTQRSLSVATGYDFNRGAWTVGPHLGTDLIVSDISTLRESGAGALDMIVGSQSSRSWTVNAGGHASYAWNLRWGVLIPHLTVDFVREFETSRDTVLVRLAADPFNSDPGNPSPSITLQSNRADPSYVMMSAGTSAQFIYGISGFVNYQQMAGMRDFKMSQVNVGLRFERQF
jgi:outer membrane autotransporter protein